jgi:hypothetical protein
MTHDSAVPASSAFEGIARGAPFRDRIVIVVKASPETIFQALHEVALRDMKFAWALGEIRYLPSRLRGHMPAVESTQPFLSSLIEGGTLILRDDSPHELITGSAAQLHRVNRAPRRFTTREAFDAFTDPHHEKLFMSIRVAPTGRPHDQWLVPEHALPIPRPPVAVDQTRGSRRPFHHQRKQLLGIFRGAESTPADTLVPSDRSPTAQKDAA